MAIAQPLSKRQADQIGYQLPQPRQAWRADKLSNSAHFRYRHPFSGHQAPPLKPPNERFNHFLDQFVLATKMKQNSAFAQPSRCSNFVEGQIRDTASHNDFFRRFQRQSFGI